MAVIDINFISESGKQAEGVGKFHNRTAGEALQGLEISMVSLTKLTSHTAYTLEARQTLGEEARFQIGFMFRNAKQYTGLT